MLGPLRRKPNSQIGERHSTFRVRSSIPRTFHNGAAATAHFALTTYFALTTCNCHDHGSPEVPGPSHVSWV